MYGLFCWIDFFCANTHGSRAQWKKKVYRLQKNVLETRKHWADEVECNVAMEKCVVFGMAFVLVAVSTSYLAENSKKHPGLQAVLSFISPFLKLVSRNYYFVRNPLFWWTCGPWVILQFFFSEHFFNFNIYGVRTYCNIRSNHLIISSTFLIKNN